MDMQADDWLLAVTRWGPGVFFTVVAVFYTARILVFTWRHSRSPIGYGRPGTEQRRLYLVWLLSGFGVVVSRVPRGALRR